MPFIFPLLAASAGTIGTAALVGGGIAAGASALASLPKTEPAPTVKPAPVMPAIAPAPTPQAAEMTAQAAIEKQRRMRALSGGRTLLTSESPTLSSGGGKTLLGS